MSVRELVYPDYDAKAFTRGDIRLVFNAPGSRLGPVHIVLTADDAESLLDVLATAIDTAEKAEAHHRKQAEKEPVDEQA